MNDKTFETYLASELMNQIISAAKDNTINFDTHSQVYYKLLQLEKHLNNYLDEYKLSMESSFWYSKEDGRIDTITYRAMRDVIKDCLDKAHQDQHYKLMPSDASLIGQLAKKTLFKYDTSSNPDTKDYSKLFEKFKYLTNYMGAGVIDSDIIAEVNAKDSSDE